MTRIKSFADLIAVWSTNAVGTIFAVAMHDLIDIATLVSKLVGIIAFAVSIWYTIHRLRKDKREKDNKG